MISDATPIICLSKLNRLDILKKLFKGVIIPYYVEKEILVEGKDGFFAISNAIKEGWIKIATPRTRRDYGLDLGENDVINLALERKDTAILDDAYAIKAAKALNIPFIRTTTFLFMAVHKRVINKGEAATYLNKLIEVGYYISPSEYAVLFAKLKE